MKYLTTQSEAEKELLGYLSREDYYGFQNVNLKDRGYGYLIIITDDEKLNTKYRDAQNDYNFTNFLSLVTVYCLDLENCCNHFAHLYTK